MDSETRRRAEEYRLRGVVAIGTLTKTKEWLEEVIKDYQDVADAKDNREDAVMGDGTDDILFGWHECAIGLLNQIKLWEGEKFDGTKLFHRLYKQD